MVVDIFNLKGRVALIPGGGGGIGSALGEALAAAGASIAIVSRTAEHAEAAAHKVAEAGGQSLALAADVTDRRKCERVVAQTVDRFGRLDIVINAVGGGAGEVLNPAEEYPRKDWDWIMELNVRSTLLPTQAAVRSMIDAISSGLGVETSRDRGRQHQGRTFSIAPHGLGRFIDRRRLCCGRHRHADV